MSYSIKTKDDPLRLFLSGGTGVGKSTVTYALYEALIRYLNSVTGENLDDVKVVKSARFYLISSFYQEPFKQTRQKHFEETKINGLPPPERYHSCPKDISTQSQEKRLRAPEN